MSLVHHQRTIEFMGITPEIDTSAVQAFDNLEKRLSRRLPASLKEWYSLKNALDNILGNQDKVFSIHQLADDPLKILADHKLFLIDENQNVCGWALDLNGTDDPPVLISDEDFDRWHDFTDTFSDFVFIRAWDYQWSDGYYLQAKQVDANFAPDLVNHLGNHYTELPISHGGFWRYIPSAKVYRFMRGQKRVLLTLQGDGVTWELRTNEYDDLVSLVKAVRPDVSIRSETRWYLDHPLYLIGKNIHTE
jgi:hypothetical protein